MEEVWRLLNRTNLWFIFLSLSDGSGNTPAIKWCCIYEHDIHGYQMTFLTRPVGFTSGLAWGLHSWIHSHQLSVHTNFKPQTNCSKWENTPVLQWKHREWNLCTSLLIHFSTYSCQISLVLLLPAGEIIKHGLIWRLSGKACFWLPPMF